MSRAAFLAWLGLVPVMIANGVVRVSIYGPWMDELLAHQISTVTGIGLLFGYTWLVYPRLGLESAGDAWRCGVVWLVLTVVFEFGFGHWVAGHPWSRLLHDYDLTAGRVWGLFLAAVVVVPWAVGRLRT